MLIGLSALLVRGQKVGSLMQGTNGPAGAPSDPVEWVSGNVNVNNGHFAEGMTVPYRLIISDLQAGEEYCVSIGWDTRVDSGHAIDFLTSYDRLAAHALFGHEQEAVDPLLGSTLEGRGLTPQRMPIPAPSDLNAAAAFNALLPPEREFTIFNGSITGIEYVFQENLEEGNASSGLRVCFEAGTENPDGQRHTVILAWGGHIASQDTWGNGSTGASKRGNTYRTALIGCSGISGCGARSLAVQASAVLAGGNCNIIGPSTLCTNGEFVFSAVGEEDAKFAWEIINDHAGASIKGAKNKRNVTIRTEGRSGSFELQLTLNGIVSCTRRIVVPGPEDLELEPASQELCPGGEATPVTWRQAPDESLATLFVLIDGTGETLATATTGEELMTFLPETPGEYFIYGEVSPEADPGCRIRSRNPAVITVREVPAPSFAAEPVCEGAATLFRNLSTSSSAIIAWSWDFGDGATSTEENPVHQFAGPGKFKVVLTAFDIDGCSGSVSGEVLVWEAPRPAFTAADICAGSEVRFINESVPGDAGILLYEWQFGDGMGSLLSDPVHRYAEPGTYTVTLIATDENGCMSELRKEVRVYEAPKAFFEAAPECMGAPVQFNQRSQQGGGAIVSYSWDFGDGEQSALASPEHLYGQARAYPVALTISDEFGCSDTYRAPVVIYPPATVGAGSDAEICEGGKLPLTASVVGAPGASWSDNGAGGSFSPDASAWNAEYTPPAGFTGEIVLTVITDDPAGPCGPESDDLLLTIYPRVTVEAGNDMEICQGDIAQLVGILNGSGSRVRWSDNGAGGTFEPDAERLDAVYLPPAAYLGEIRLTLSTSDPAGPCGPESDELMLSVSRPASVDAGADAAICEGQTYQLNGRIGGGASGGSWSDNGAGGVFAPRASLLNASYTPPPGYRGRIVLTLTTEDPAGPCPSLSDELIVEVFATAQPSFQAAEVCDGQAVKFINTSGSGAGQISRILWDFGDGQQSAEEEPEHVFPGPGEYDVTLTISNSLGCSAGTIRTVVIHPRPASRFTAEAVCQDQPVIFSHFPEGGGPPFSYEWDFGDGSAGTGKDPEHRYGEPGSYTVRLSVTDAKGCASTTTEAITVRAAPLAGFEADPGCAGTAIAFANSSRAGDAAISKYEWDFGDGTRSGEANPVRSYTSAGVFTARLTVIDQEGCTDFTTRKIEVYALPEVNFSADEVCHGQPVLFTDLSGPLESYLWDFGDGQSSTLAEPVQEYGSPGNYKVTLTGTGGNGCTASAERTVRVNMPPRAAFSAGEACSGEEMDFLNESRGGGSPLSRFEWRYGDGTRADGVSPSHSFAEPGTYEVFLTAFDEQGCSDTYSAEVTVLPLPKPGFTAEVFCSNAEVAFANESEMPGAEIVSYRWDFGDRQTSREANPRHSFAGPGRYTVTLEVINARGCRATLAKEVVIPRPPVAAFDVSDVCAGGAGLQVTNLSRPAPGGSPDLAYLWIVRDGRGQVVAGSRQGNPVFDLPPGRYLIQLELSGEGNCSAFASREVEVHEDPVVSIEAVPDLVCEGEETIVLARISGGAGCDGLEWQRATSLQGPWRRIAGATGQELNVDAGPGAGTWFYRAIYRCAGGNCGDAVSNIVSVEVRPGTADLSCVDQVDLPLCSGCTLAVTPLMVAEGAFSSCFPYREEDFEVIVYDLTYPNGAPDNVIEAPGSFNFRLQLKPEAVNAGAVFTPCESSLRVGDQTPPTDDGSGEGMISGSVRTEFGKPVEEVMVRLSGQAEGLTMTDAQGRYSFPGLRQGHALSIVPLLDRDYVNGVTTFDLLKIDKHILTTDPLDSPYQIIAADANNDKRVTSFDLIQFRKLILTLIDDLPDNVSWRFVDGSFRFPNPGNPWQAYFPELISVDDLQGDIDGNDFIAIKIGDVNGTARTSKLLDADLRSEAGAFVLQVEDRDLIAGNTYEVAFRAEDMQGVSACQFTLEWDLGELEFVDLKYGLAAEENFGVFPSEGVLTTSWIKPEAAEGLAGEELFRLVLRARTDQRLSGAIRITSRHTVAEAYDPGGEVLKVTLDFGAQAAESTSFELLPNRPNPWRDYTLIGFTLPQAGEARLTVMDVNGRLLARFGGLFERGYNEIRLDKGSLPAGVLCYLLESAGHAATRKMVVIE